MNSPANATGEQPLMVATFQVLRRYRTWILATSAVVVAAAIAASLLMTRIYEAEVLVAHSSAQSSDETLGMLASRLGALMPMAGLGFGDVSYGRPEAIATLTSRTLSLKFIEKYGLMPHLFPELWDAGAKKWKGDPPTEAEAFERFDERVRSLSEDTATGLITVSIRGVDPRLAADWANALVRDANEYLSDRALTEARVSIAALEDALQKTNTLEVRQIIYGLIETQLSNATLAKTRADYAVRVIDPAAAPDADDYVQPRPVLYIAIALLLGPVLGFLLALMRESWTQSR